MQKRTVLFTLIVSILILPGTVQGQQENRLSPNTAIEDSITTAEETDIWTFFALREDVYTFQVEATSAGFDPVLTIQNENGAVITNDDYDYPDHRNALLEAITIPKTGSYEVVVTGFGQSTGDYLLRMLPGYAEVAVDERFVVLGNWTAGNVPAASIADGTLIVTQTGVRARGFILDSQGPELADFYAQVDVPSVTGINGWLVGLAIRQQPNGDGYMAQVHASGWWRFIAMEGGADRVIRDWNPHPAITPGDTRFTLGVLANDGGFEVFYNGQLVGRARDTVFGEGGRVGLVVETPDVLESELTAVFDSLLITVPLEIDGQRVFPEQIVDDDPTIIARELERRHVLPGGGQMIWVVEESFAERGFPGVGRLWLARGALFRNLALGTTFSLEAPLPEVGVSGCGLLFGNVSDTDFAIAYMDNSGAYGVSQRVGEAFQPGIYIEGDAFSGENTLVVALYENVLHYYVNGRHVGTMAMNAQAGEVGNVVVTFDPVSASCRFRNTWLWSWEEPQ